MKNQKGFVLIEMIVAFIVGFVLVCWAYNLYQVAECDFEAPYKCEFMHSIGLVPPFAPFTVWFDTDNSTE